MDSAYRLEPGAGAAFPPAVVAVFVFLGGLLPGKGSGY